MQVLFKHLTMKCPKCARWMSLKKGIFTCHCGYVDTEEEIEKQQTHFWDGALNKK